MFFPVNGGLMNYFKYNVKAKESGKNLKEWLLSFNLAKNKINYLIDNKCISINQEIVYKREYLLKENDEILIDISNYEQIDYLPLRYNLDIIYEDEYLLVVNKPKGVIIYPENKELSNTMANYIAYYYTKTNQNKTIRHAHRLDTDTTGCLVYAKDVITHSYLSNLFENGKVKKEYNALVYGIIKESGKIETPISRNRHNNSMMVSKSGLDALTLFKPMKYYNGNTLLNVEIKTGRTHQIRVHLSSIKHPLLGDKMYGKDDDVERVMLHCNHIGFVHPILGYWVDFYANMPQDMKKYIGE